MLQKIRIRNFRSLKDITVDLKEVNLLIGSNNSGKSNFLKAFEFLHLFYTSGQILQESFSRNYFGFKEINKLRENSGPMSFSFFFELGNKIYGIYILEIFGTSDTSSPIYREFAGTAKKDLSYMDLDDIYNYDDEFRSISLNIVNHAPCRKITGKYKINIPTANGFVLTRNQDNKLLTNIIEKTGLDFIRSFNGLHTEILSRFFENIVIYQPDTNKLKVPGFLGTEKYLQKDVSNLVSFLDNLRDSNPEILEEIRQGLEDCGKDFNDIRFEKIDQNGKLFKKLGLRDSNKNIFWSDELSEGTLYFLALLSIIHQPNPPALILLEEPEKGIHPRRVSEIMNFIFRLAEDKGVQIVLTSHSTQLLDEFDDIPESVFIFEMENGESKIKNLQTDIILPAKNKSKIKKLPEIRYTELLGEKWLQGFLGGVPG